MLAPDPETPEMLAPDPETPEMLAPDLQSIDPGSKFTGYPEGGSRPDPFSRLATRVPV
jgi:hypothetical protein